MASEIDVCNEALNLLGDDSITALTESTDAARMCNRFYASARDKVLGSHNWRCCSKRVQLAMLAETPAFDYTYYFQIPSDCVKIIRTDLDDAGYVWKREGNKIATDEGTVYLEYVQRITDPTKWPIWLKEAIVYCLQEKICVGIGHADLKDKLKADYEEARVLAEFYDATEASQEEIINTQLTEVR